MSARDRFSKGDPVVMTPLAIDGRLNGVRIDRRTGVVVGFGREPQLVRIRRDGEKYSHSYHEDFWERAKHPEGK